MAAKQKILTTFETGRGYGREDWDAVEFPELSDEELARMRPAPEVLQPAFFKAMEDHRRWHGSANMAHPQQ